MLDGEASRFLLAPRLMGQPDTRLEFSGARFFVATTDWVQIGVGTQKLIIIMTKSYVTQSFAELIRTYVHVSRLRSELLT